MKKNVVARSGRFAAGPADEVARFTESVSFDHRLWRQDIRGSIAHASMLRSIGILSATELQAIKKALREISREIAAGRFLWNPDLEDVHMNLEAELTRRVPAGAKIHTGRSRNDQVALDMRLWVRDAISELTGDVRRLQQSLVHLASRHCQAVLPGYTHLQRAQPVLFAHHLLAYVEMLDRDHERLMDALERVNVCPLGCGALAGSTLPLDRRQVAVMLGFVDRRGRPRIARNSMDAVSDRDFVIEFCGAIALLGVHLSRLAEDVVLWCSAEFGFLRIEDAFTTGSSLMPQKKNPDLAELARGKSARLIGNLTALLTLLKGLPMTYNRDLQEDKERLFDSADQIRSTVRVMASMLRHSEVCESVCRAAAEDPALLATDLADYLVVRGMPFRQAHHVVGAIVALAAKKTKPLDKLSLAELRSVHAGFNKDALDVFNLDRALAARNHADMPGPKQVANEVKRWRKKLA